MTPDIDVYEYQDRTQILLLHLPDDSRWKLFENVKLSLEDQIIEDSRKRFENNSVQNPVPELSTEDWLARCSAPLGMNDAGELLNEPHADFGVHHGVSIPIVPYKQDDGSIICVSPQRD